MLRVVALGGSLLWLSSCVLITGSTSGFVVEAGAPPPSCAASDDAGAAGDASCSGLVLNCLSAANCSAGQSCCLAVSGSALITTCSALPCPTAIGVQVCQTSSECGHDGGTCSRQRCTFGSLSSTVSLCASLPVFCSPE